MILRLPSAGHPTSPLSSPSAGRRRAIPRPPADTPTSLLDPPSRACGCHGATNNVRATLTNPTHLTRRGQHKGARDFHSGTEESVGGR